MNNNVECSLWLHAGPIGVQEIDRLLITSRFGCGAWAHSAALRQLRSKAA